MKNHKFFNIQTAAQLASLSPHTIRAWEKRYQALKPQRSDTGRRLYSSEEVDRLSLLSQLTQFGHSIGQIAQLSTNELKDMSEKMHHHQNKKTRSTNLQNSLIDSNELLNHLIMSCEINDIQKTSSLLNESYSKINPRDLALKVLSPLIGHIRQQLEKEKISHGYFHTVKALLKFYVGTIIYGHYEKNLKSNLKIILTTIDGNYFVFDTLLATLLCCHYKLDFIYLSSSLPNQSIKEAAQSLEADILILGLDKTKNGKETQKSLDELQVMLPSTTKLILLNPPRDIVLNQKQANIVASIEQLDLELQSLI